MPWKNSWFQAAIFTALVSGGLLLSDFVWGPSKRGTGSSSSSAGDSQSSSLVGDWNLSQCALSVAQTSAIGDLITAALTGNNVQGYLQVKSLNQYSISLKATDAGTVTPHDGVSTQGVSSNALTFTSDSTHKPLVVSYQKLDNGGQFASLGVPAGEQILLFGVNVGAGEVILHGLPEGGGENGKIDQALIGTWTGTPFNVNPPNNLWSGSVAIHGDGTYLITVTRTENGILDAESGNWTTKPAGSNMGGGFMPRTMDGLFVSGHYSLSDSTTLSIATDDGTFTFKRE